MFHNLNYTIQETGDHTYSRCVGELLCQLIEIKVRKDTLVMPETLMMSLQVKSEGNVNEEQPAIPAGVPDLQAVI